MLKKLLFILLLVCVPFAGGKLYSQCNPNKIARKYKGNLTGYIYDSSAYNPINFTDKPQNIEVVFSAYAGNIYKLVFGTSMFDENVTVNIYDKSSRVKNRKKLFDNTSGIDNMFWELPITKPGTYYIDYSIPPKGTSASSDGCVVILIGYQMANKGK